MIPEELLNKYGGIRYNVPKGQYIFHEGDKPFHYFQILLGAAKLVNFSKDGQEFIQGMFKANQPIAEATIFGSFPFPSNAVAIEDSRICKVPKDRFFDLLKENPDIHFNFSQSLSKKLHFKTMVGMQMALNNPESQVAALIEYYKMYTSPNDEKSKMLIPYTRQQIAGITGLRVETVIRTIKKMEQKGLLSLKDHKIIA